MNTFAVIYTYDPNQADLTSQVRPSHRQFLKSLFDTGALKASGPLSGGRALIVVEAESSEGARELLTRDPFNEAGVLLDVDVAEWTVVYGPWA
ncbi:YciI family protein [Arcanobacterium pinnipediorum]|uniref:YciI family protein n=1 Tax=Arcanobacterium pinnipediorum TaxID=1503041 RepID=A0ABY5AF70_9ACTO|nr:YciI family protein [Arcanobacterium pinnipediorum]USR78655.1 YciI family protein [Arcanobacterium pinnipediorum]